MNEEAELFDAQAMLVDEEKHFSAWMALKHLGIMLGGVAIFSGIVWTLMPSKPWTEKRLDWEAVDKTYGGYTKFAETEDARTFRGKY